MIDRTEFVNLANHLGFSINSEWTSFDDLYPLIEFITYQSGAIFYLKIDGQRTDEDDNGNFTAILGGGIFGSQNISIDSDALEDAVAKCLFRSMKKISQIRGEKKKSNKRQ